jgi:putative transposase
VVWGTHLREPLIDRSRATLIEQSIHATCKEKRAFVHALGFMPEHVHLAVSIPPALAVATFIQQIKGRSSHWVNLQGVGTPGSQFKWQPDYSVNSFAEGSLERVKAYVINQADHHTNEIIWPNWEPGDLVQR